LGKKQKTKREQVGKNKKNFFVIFVTSPSASTFDFFFFFV